MATLRTLIYLILMIATQGRPADATPFTPTDDHAVLERLPAVSGAGAGGEVRRLMQQLTMNPGDLAVAVEVATRFLQMGRVESDPRYQGYAQAALAPWWADAQAPVPVRILRATIRQNQHDFPSALIDLDAVLAGNPRHAQARLTRATIHRVLGRFAEAKRDCLQLFRVVSELLAVTCAAEIGSLTGQGEQAYALMERTWEHSSQTPIAERLWALAALAEMASRIGKPKLAERHYLAALQLDPRDSYLLGSYADFLLDQGRPQDVVALLNGKERADALLLRLALAERRLHRPQASDHIAALAARFDAARMRGDVVHRREEARFALACLNQPARALDLAQANWSVQREPADARIVLESASAVGDRTAVQSVLAWMRDQHVTDTQLQRLAAEVS